MIYRAAVSFAGRYVSMSEGEERNLETDIASPLLKCGYLKEVKEKENKRADAKCNTKSHSRSTGKSDS